MLVVPKGKLISGRLGSCVGARWGFEMITGELGGEDWRAGSLSSNPARVGVVLGGKLSMSVRDVITETGKSELKRGSAGARADRGRVSTKK